MTRLMVEFYLPVPYVLRLVLSVEGEGVIDMVEDDPRSDGAYGTFHAALTFFNLPAPVEFQISADFECDFGKLTAPKSIAKRAVEAAIQSTAGLGPRTINA